MAFGVETITARLGHNTITSPMYRPPQVPIGVEGYPIAPDGLKLEQVHVYVRHGECYDSLLYPGHYIFCLVRWTYTSWHPTLPATCIDSGTLDNVQDCQAVPGRCPWAEWRAWIYNYSEDGGKGRLWHCFGWMVGSILTPAIALTLFFRFFSLLGELTDVGRQVFVLQPLKTLLTSISVYLPFWERSKRTICREVRVCQSFVVSLLVLNQIFSGSVSYRTSLVTRTKSIFGTN